MTLKVVRIGELGRIVTGDTPLKSRSEFYGSAYPFIKPTDMKVGQRFTLAYDESYSEEAYEKYQKKLIPAGSIAVVTIGSIGQKLTLTHTPCFVNQAVNAVIPDPSRFDSLYVYYLLRHNLQLVKSADTGASSGRENVSKSNFSGIELLASLDLDEQKRIAKVLDSYDSLIETNRRRIALLEESARLLYREWFVNLRFPGHQELRVNDGPPSTWQIKKLGDVVEAIGGATPSTTRPDYWDGDIVWLTPTDVTHNDCLYLADSGRKITATGYESCSAKVLPPGTIFMTSRASIGFFALLDQPACTNQGFIAVIPKVENARNFFLFHLMSRVEEFETKATGTTFKELSKKAFKELSVLMPVQEILVAFEQSVEPIIEQVFVIKKQNILLTEARDAMLPKLMSDEIQV